MRPAIPSILLSFSLFLVLSCGEEIPSTANGQLRGTVWLSSPVADAKVSAWVVGDNWENAFDTPIATTTSAGDGSYTLPLGTNFGRIRVVAQGGNTIEVASSEPLELDEIARLSLLLPTVAADADLTNVTLSPITSLADEWTRARVRVPSLPRGEALDLFGAHIGDVAPHATTPANVRSGEMTLTEETRYGLVLAGLSRLAFDIADESRLTANAVNTYSLTRVLVHDLRDQTVIFDGEGETGPISIGSCDRPAGCTREDCPVACDITPNTLRSKLAGSLTRFLASSSNATGLSFSDIRPFAEGIRNNREAQLFGDADVEELDGQGPKLTWKSPAADAIVAAEFTIEVHADDPTGVDSLVVELDGAVVGEDEDPSPDVFRISNFDSTKLGGDGPKTLTAVAVDRLTNRSESPRNVTLNNSGAGAMAGIVVKGPVANADVSAYRFAGGVRGGVLATTSTKPDGTYYFTLEEGYSGPLLVESVGGTYTEEASPKLVPIDSNDILRTIVPNYQDGHSVENVVVTPLTSLATTYSEHLLANTAKTDDDIANSWALSTQLLSEHFDISDIANQRPLTPENMTGLSSAARYSLALIGLSQMAFSDSNDSGGEAGSFGTAVNAVSVWRLLEQDLADGCWDGKANGEALSLGSHVFTAATPRFEFAQAIVAYLTGAENTTPFGSAADVLRILDKLSQSGPASSSAGCQAGQLFAEPGHNFDKEPPTVAFVSPTPLSGTVVGGTITIAALAMDNLAPKPSIRFTSPALLAGKDNDGDDTDSDVTATIDTRTLGPDGAMTFAAVAKDQSDNESPPKEHTLIVDNTPPTVFLSGVVDGSWYRTPVTVSFGHSDPHPGSVTATLNGAAYASGSPITAQGGHLLRVHATDAAGNHATPASAAFTIDTTPPVLTRREGPGSWARGNVVIEIAATDNLQAIGSLSEEITVVGRDLVRGTTINPALVTLVHTNLSDRTVRAVFNSAAYLDGLGDPMDGMVEFRFGVADQAGNLATPLAVSFSIDNTPPEITLDTITAPYFEEDDTYFTASNAPRLAGTLTPGGSPVTVTVTVGGQPNTGTVAGSGWSYQLPDTADSSQTLHITARDAAGNVAPNSIANKTLIVDTTGPAIGVAPSTMDDESKYGIDFGEAPEDHDAFFSGQGSDDVKLEEDGTPTIRKYVTRLDDPAHNPIRWVVDSNDGAAGVAIAPTTIEYRVYADGDTPPASWRASADAAPHITGIRSGVEILADANAKLRSTTTDFHVDFRSLDRLGNPSAIITRTWHHHPLAPPLKVRYKGGPPVSGPLANMSINRVGLRGKSFDVTDMLDPGFALPANLLGSPPSVIAEYTVINPHPQTVRMGFFLPSPVGATYHKRIWEENPWREPRPLLRKCSKNWAGELWLDTQAPYRLPDEICADSPLWSVPSNATPDPIPVPLATSLLELRAYDTRGATAILPRITEASGGITTITVDGTTYEYYEFDIPARIAPNLPTTVILAPALKSFQTFSPVAFGEPLTKTPLFDGTRITGQIITDYVDCSKTWPVIDEGFLRTKCLEMRRRQHYKALVEAKVTIPESTMSLRGRSRISESTQLEIPGRLRWR